MLLLLLKHGIWKNVNFNNNEFLQYLSNKLKKNKNKKGEQKDNTNRRLQPELAQI